MSYIFKDISGLVFVEKLMGWIFIGIYWRGKYFFVVLDNSDYVFFYFGMSGCFCYYDDFIEQFKYECFVFDFEDGGCFGFDCFCKLVCIYYVEDFDVFIVKKNLGEDVFVFKEVDFLEMAKGCKGIIKGFLFN